MPIALPLVLCLLVPDAAAAQAPEPGDWAVGSPVAGQADESVWGPVTVAVPQEAWASVDFPPTEDGLRTGLEHDFDGDGHREVLVSSAPWCGASGNCSYVLVDGRTNALLGVFSGGLILVRALRVAAWPVIETWHGMGAGSGLYSVHIPHGGRYTELTQVLVEGEGRERLLSRFARALRPRNGMPDPAPDKSSAGKPACRDTTITGRVAHGQVFEAEIGGGLLFRLDPNVPHPRNPQGWRIGVTPVQDRDADYLRVVTPPYRFSNRRYVDTGYGHTAEEALAWTPRTFRFVGNRRDFELARESLEVLLWSGEHTEDEIARARAVRDSLRTYEGEFTIVDGAVRDRDRDDSPGIIDWLSFRVVLCVPTEDSR